jgi:hypothetical protein
MARFDTIILFTYAHLITIYPKTVISWAC